MKKIEKLGLVSALLLGASSLAGCESTSEEVKFTPVAKEDIKIGLICIHDDSSSYDANFISSMYTALDELGLSKEQLKLSTGIPEGSKCYDEASKLAQSCNVIFGDSFGHEDYLIQAASEFPNVRFAHATGTKAHTTGLNNYSNAFASIYEGRYLAGIVAGQKLNEMIEAKEFEAKDAKMGYVGAFSYAEVISGFTSFYLGAKSVCPTVTMDVKFTGSWYDYDAEAAAAQALIDGGAKLISGHADSYGAPTVCENHTPNAVPNVAYNLSTKSQCPKSYLVSSKIDWAPYFKYIINQTINGEKIDTDWSGDLASGSVKLTEYGNGVSDTAKQLVEAAKAKIIAKELHVFDTNTFTVEGKKLESYLADVDDFGDYVPETEAISDGYFHESEYRSGPYFNVSIDGITWLNSAF